MKLSRFLKIYVNESVVPLQSPLIGERDSSGTILPAILGIVPYLLTGKIQGQSEKDEVYSHLLTNLHNHREPALGINKQILKTIFQTLKFS